MRSTQNASPQWGYGGLDNGVSSKQTKEEMGPYRGLLGTRGAEAFA